MKSQRRHELGTNELAEWIGQLPQFWKKNYKIIIYIAVVVILVGIAAYFKMYRVRAEKLQKRVEIANLLMKLSDSKQRTIVGRASGLEESDLLLIVADNLRTAAQDIKEDDYLVALALIKRAEALRAELHYKPVTSETGVIVHQINQAKQCYEQALPKAAGQATLRALAKYGLGLCEEELGKFEDAERIYREIVDNTEFEGTIVVAQARQRLATMADYREKVVFVKAPPEPEITEPVSTQSEPNAGEQPAPIVVEINSPGR